MDILAACLTKLDVAWTNGSEENPRYHATCPNCGHPPHSHTNARATHFFVDRKGAKCFACDKWWSLSQLAEELGARGDFALPAYRPPPRPKAPWESVGALDVYRQMTARRADLVARWQAYKPVSAETIRRFDLGIGKLPFYNEDDKRWFGGKYERLLLPLIVNDKIVGFTGRAIDPEDDGPKWLTSTHSDLSHLFGVDRVRPGGTVVICENRLDSLLAGQIKPDIDFVACGGARWDDGWTHTLIARRPARVIVWLDHDLAGNGSRWHERELLAAWRGPIEERRRRDPALAARPFPKPPEPRGPKIANALLEAGYRNASVYTWPRGTPLKQDLGAELMHLA